MGVFECSVNLLGVCRLGWEGQWRGVVDGAPIGF